MTINYYENDNIASIYYDLIRDIQHKGVLEAKTRELLNVQICLSDPRYSILPYKKNWQWAFQELLDRMSFTYGYKRLCNPGRAFIYRSNWKKKLAKEGGKFHYSYGELFNDQINGALKELKSRKATREAVMALWTPKYLLRQPDFNRRPCTLTFHFIIREKKLLCFVNMRSNDVINLLPYDIFHHTFIQRWIAYQLGIECGEYYHSSTHSYYPKKRESKGRQYFENFYSKFSIELNALDYRDYTPLELGDSLDEDFKLIYDNYNDISSIHGKIRSPFLGGLIGHIINPSNCNYLI